MTTTMGTTMTGGATTMIGEGATMLSAWRMRRGTEITPGAAHAISIREHNNIDDDDDDDNDENFECRIDRPILRDNTLDVRPLLRDRSPFSSAH